MLLKISSFFVPQKRSLFLRLIYLRVLWNGYNGRSWEAQGCSGDDDDDDGVDDYDDDSDDDDDDDDDDDLSFHSRLAMQR